MFVPFSSLPRESRVWIFQANRPFTPTELNPITERLQAFTEEWSVHGLPLKTSFLIRFNQFIILAADETDDQASGCSIDSSVRALKALEQSFGIDLFDRNRVAFNRDSQVLLVPLQELKQKFEDGTLNEDSLTFNNLVTTRSAFEESWIIPVRQSWLRRYMPDSLAKVR